MRTVRVTNRGGSLWFLLGGILVLLAAITAVFAQGNARWVAPAVIGGLAAAAFAYALYGAKRHIDLGDQIVVRYFLRERVIPWGEVTFVELDREQMRIKTGIPFVSIPTENHTLTLRLRDGSAVTADVAPSKFPAIAEVVQRRANFDVEHERTRREAAAASERKSDRWLKIAGGLFFLVGGIWTAVSMREEVVDGVASAGWPTAPATITRADVGSKRASSGRRGRDTTHYFPVVEYSYTVHGQSYTGARYRFSPETSTDRDDAQRLLAQLQSADPVLVRYKPADPSTSVLVPGIGAWWYVLFGGAILAAVGGLVFAAIHLLRSPGRGRMRGSGSGGEFVVRPMGR
jgi:hypothetical protein